MRRYLHGVPMQVSHLDFQVVSSNLDVSGIFFSLESFSQYSIAWALGSIGGSCADAKRPSWVRASRSSLIFMSVDGKLDRWPFAEFECFCYDCDRLMGLWTVAVADEVWYLSMSRDDFYTPSRGRLSFALSIIWNNIQSLFDHSRRFMTASVAHQQCQGRKKKTTPSLHLDHHPIQATFSLWRAVYDMQCIGTFMDFRTNNAQNSHWFEMLWSRVRLSSPPRLSWSQP